MHPLQKTCRSLLLTICCAHGAVFFSHAAQGAVLSLEEFLHQVSRSNGDYLSMQMDSQGSELSSKVATLLFKPRVYTNMQYVYDPRDTHVPDLEGNRQIIRNASVGIQEQTPFGLQLQLSMDYSQSALLGTNSPLVTNQTITNIYPVPGFNFSLWQNFLGRMDRANRSLLEAQSLAKAYGKSFGARATLVEAEGRYWKLATIREAIRLQKDSLQRARDLLAIENRKKAKHLSDVSDVLLGEAAVQGKELELRSYAAEERAAARALNASRGIDSDQVAEALNVPGVETVLDAIAPAKPGIRGDVRVAEQEAIATRSGDEMAREKLLPTFNLYGSVYMVGVVFTLPLDQGATVEARQGYARQSDAADLAYQKKIFDAENDWKDLVARLNETKERLELAVKLETVQKLKFEEIRRKRDRGLTVAFQVFQYELDYLSATQTRLQIQGTLLGIRAQMKLYGSGS